MRIFSGFLLFVIWLSSARGDNNYDARDKLLAVCPGRDYVLATTSNGLFRASTRTKKWVQLHPPKEISTAGVFGRVPTNADFVLFVSAAGDSNSAGLFRSRDKGESWQLLSKEFNFRTVYAHEDGAIYATATKPGTWSPFANQVLMSTNSGTTWRDLSLGTQGLDILSIIPDPDHTNLVCLVGCTLRGYILQATNRLYEWKWHREFNWKQNEPSDERFFRPCYMAEWILYSYCATLRNYFDYDFGDLQTGGDVETCAFRLTTDKTNFQFRLIGPKRIHAKISFLPTETAVKLVDCTRGNQMWGLRVKTPDAQYLWAGGRSDAKDGQVRSRKDFRVVELTSENPYRKTIDLNEIFEFSKPGKYVLQLIYYNSGVAKRNLEEWPGSFGSKTLTVTLKE